MKKIKYAFLCLFLSGCIFGVSQTSKFYSLTTIETMPVSQSEDLFIGVDKVDLPKYMDRAQIVTQNKNGRQVLISEYNRWVESPSVLCTRILTQNLNYLLPKSDAKIRTLGSEKFDRRVWVQVVQMDGVLGQQAKLSAWFTIKNTKGKTIVHQKFTDKIEIGKTYDDLVVGYSKLWSKLSQDIAKQLIQK
jgi:uncharacterized lipoprotein YmbA